MIKYHRSLREPEPPCAIDNIDIGELSADTISRLIGLIYEGLLEPVPWTGILRWLNKNFNANWSTLVLRPASKERLSLIIQAHLQEVTVSSADYAFFDTYSTDPFTDLPLNRVTTPEEFLGSKQWFSNKFFTEYLQLHNIRYELGADFRADDHSECRFRICKAEAAGAFTDAERELCQLLLPHFSRAVYLHSQLYTSEVEKKLYGATFERLHIGTLILDETGTLLNANSAADDILAEKDGIWLSNNKLHLRQKDLEQRLHAAVRDVLATRSAEPIIKAFSIPRTTNRADLKVLVKNIPLTEHVEGNHRPSVAIFIHDPEFKSAPPVDILRMLFNFTPAEAHFAKLLAEGYSLDEAGDRLGISRNTVKSRLRSIFAKTGVTRQSSLVRILLGSMVSL